MIAFKTSPEVVQPLSYISSFDDKFYQYARSNAVCMESLGSVPAAYDFRLQFNNALTLVWQQGTCGACWSIASTSALADRYAFYTNEQVTPLSSQYLLMCARGRNTSDTTFEGGLMGCGGGTLVQAWEFLRDFGTLSSRCWHYDLQDATEPMEAPPDTLVCDPQVCPDDGTPPYLYRASEAYVVLGTPSQHATHGNEANIRREMFRNGPNSCTFIMYDDFLTYWNKLQRTPGAMRGKNAVYQWDGKSAQSGMHAVRMIGWGTVEGVDYWIIANSWGFMDYQNLNGWGINGCFLIRRGANECDIESNIVAGLPMLPPGARSLIGTVPPRILHMPPAGAMPPKFMCNIWVVPLSQGLTHAYQLGPVFDLQRKYVRDIAPLTNRNLSIVRLGECPEHTPHKCPNGVCLPADYDCTWNECTC